MTYRILAVLITPLLFFPVGSSFAQPAKIPVILDTDIGTDIDDAYALALILNSPELDLRGVTASAGQTLDRAWMLCRFLTQTGHRHIPVAVGQEPQSDSTVDWQIQYRRHPGVIFNRTTKPLKETAVAFLYSQLKANADKEKLTLITVGPLTNVARLLSEHPDCKPWIKRIVMMGGSVRVGYNLKPPPIVEWNIRTDIKAAQVVFASGLPLVVAPLDATASVRLEEPMRAKIFAACTPITYQVQALNQLWEGGSTPTLYDPVAVALCFDESFCKMEDLHLAVDDKGITRIGTGKPNARVATAVDAPRFLDWFVKRLSAGETILPRQPQNLSSLVEQGNFPTRVHTFEDYDTDIEKRWWMCGRVYHDSDKKNRICRSVLTQDFDDRQGEMMVASAAVIFNPVPGPPMGKNTRLSFRYRLHGTDTMRVQLYSLSNGYHRYLAIKGLPQDAWQSATVDMTQMRRPDGTGGPLAENERIDDIQFYVDPRAEVLIDDIVLYEAAAADEKRPFPKRVHYTGWFDSGKQGKEWPGTFDIAKEGFFWRAAQSIAHPDTGKPSLVLHLRGERTLGKNTELFFRYKLAGADTLQVGLANRKSKSIHLVDLKNATQGDWAKATLNFSKATPAAPGAGDRVDEIQFLLPGGAALLIDDVLLYEP